MRVQLLRRHRRLAPWISLAVALILIAMAVYLVTTSNVPQWVRAYRRDQSSELANLLIALAGWALALTGLLFAGEQALRGLTFDALSKLHSDEGDPEQADAKRLVWQAAPPGDIPVNPYTHARQYVERLSPEDQEKLDKARHRLTHFWYRAARLADLGILDPDEIFTSVGHPDILAILEVLEAIKAESVDPNWQPRSWPPMKLLIAWCEQQGRYEEARRLLPQVPAQPYLYVASRADMTN